MLTSVICRMLTLFGKWWRNQLLSFTQLDRYFVLWSIAVILNMHTHVHMYTHRHAHTQTHTSTPTNTDVCAHALVHILCPTSFNTYSSTVVGVLTWSNVQPRPFLCVLLMIGDISWCHRIVVSVWSADGWTGPVLVWEHPHHVWANTGHSVQVWNMYTHYTCTHANTTLTHTTLTHTTHTHTHAHTHTHTHTHLQ